MEHNKSLSARIKRRNKQGFEGVGNYHGLGPYPHPYGDYTDPVQNHKLSQFELSKRRKNRSRSNGYISSTKKYADNKQKVVKSVKSI